MSCQESKNTSMLLVPHLNLAGGQLSVTALSVDGTLQAGSLGAKGVSYLKSVPI